MTADCVTVTAPAVAVNVPSADPAAIVIMDGTGIAGLLLAKDKVTPPAPAATEICTVQVDVSPAFRLLG